MRKAKILEEMSPGLVRVMERVTWERFQDLLRDFPLPKPRAYIDLWNTP